MKHFLFKRLSKVLLLFVVLLVCVAQVLAAAEVTAGSLSSSTTLSLTPQEQDWLARNPLLTIALDDGNPPMNFLAGDGTYSGVSVEYLELIGKKLGVEIKFWGAAWSDALRRALDHEVDGIMTASIKEDRKPFLNFTEPYVTTPEVLATRKDFKKITSFSDLDGQDIAVVRDSVRVSILKERCPNSTLHEVESPEDGIKALVEGHVAAFFDDLPVVQHAIEGGLMTNLKIALLYYSDAGAARVGLRNDTPELLSIFNKAIADISFEEHRKIRNRWFGNTEVAAVESDLSLTAKEKEWLKAHPVIRVATDPDWRPIEYLDSDGQFRGIAIDYLRRIEQQLGVRFEIVRGKNWAELVEMAKAREIDMFTCITQTPDRAQYLLFTEPYLSFPASIFTRNNAPYVGDLRELDHQKVAVVNGYAFHELLKRNHPLIDLVPVGTTLQGLQMLEDGKVEAYVGNLLVASYYITARGSVTLKVAGETPYRNDLSFAPRSDWPVLAGILDKTLKSISPEEKRDIYKDWVSLSYQQELDKKLIAQIVLALVAVFACILIVIQRRQLRARQAAMLEISRRKAEFEVLFNAMTDALVMTDLERRIVMVNTGFKNIFGYTLADVQGQTTEVIYADPDQFKELGKTRYSRDAEISQPVFEMEYRRKNGEVFPGETIGVKVIDPSGSVVGFLGCIRDITERKQSTEELVRYRDNLQSLVDEQTLELKKAHNELLQKERLATLGQLTATVSHELRNPLATIKTALFAIEDTMARNEPQQALRSVELAERNIDRCVNIIEELNAYAREKELEVTEVNLDDWLRATVEEILIPAEIQVELKLLCDETVCFDKEKLRQVVVNLVVNAVHALQDQRSAGKKLQISCFMQNDGFEVVVSDNGVGMTEDTKEKLFEPLFSTKSFGLGLGMVVVKKIVEQHQGEVSIESEVGVGTKITCRLPKSLCEKIT